jgi:Outer membrane protein beta-barrel domain
VLAFFLSLKRAQSRVSLGGIQTTIGLIRGPREWIISRGGSMRFMKVALLCSGLSLASAGSALAAHPQERKGVWFGLGGGYGSATVTCDDCAPEDRDSGGTAFLKLGGTLNEHVLLGGEFNFWRKDEDLVAHNIYNVSATVTFYPSASSGFFFKGGAGWAVAETEYRVGSTTYTHKLGSGLGLLVGAGYDLRVARKISITPGLNYYEGRLGDRLVGGDMFFPNWQHNVLDISIGVTFH